MNKILMILSLFLVLGILGSCEDFVQDIDPLIDEVDDELLNDPAQVPFIVKGLQQRFATSAGRVAMLADGLADMLFFDQDLPLATFPSYKEIDEGDIQLDNNTVDGIYNDIGELIFFSDGLLERLDQMDGLTDDVRAEAEYASNFYSGMGRYFLGSYFGLTETQGGGPIDVGPFIPTAQLYAEAIDKLNAALAQAPDTTAERVVNSLIARIYLYSGDYSNAAAFAANGMKDIDEPFVALHNVEWTNRYYQQAGNGRVQWVVDFRFNDYVTADPAEAARIPLREEEGTSMTIYYVQDKYTARESSYEVFTWQENHLILAELAIRNGTGDGLAEVNAVRASYGIGALSSLTLEDLMVEREKTLFCTGNRLIDQRRSGTFHLPSGSWEYLPITQQERNINPNL